MFKISHNPDVLSCLANLSSDEVFTPPGLANQILDLLPKELWSDPEATFLDPVCKSGIFLREIARRLDAGLAEAIPDKQERLNHIFTKQLFGLAITDLTALLSRRSVYCSKTANGKYSVCDAFTDDQGNIRYERIEHSWDGNRCRYCSAPRTIFDREEGLETHAYAFIHTDDIKTRLPELFGGQMQFDVIIGNPPYQMTGGAGGSSDSSIYHLFVEQAVKLQPRFLCMIIPSRWLAGGRGMDDFRKAMLTGRHISHMVDYTKMSTAFPGVDFEGGVGYFLWDKNHDGDCEYTLFQGDERQPTVTRDLGAHDIFIRDHRSLTILEKVQARGEPTVERIISGDTPFGLATNFSDWKTKPFAESLVLHLTVRGKRTVGYVSRSAVRKNTHLINAWKVLLPEAYGERGAIPAFVLGASIVAAPKSVCTQTYLVAGPFDVRAEADNFKSYAETRFFRFLVSLRKITQHALRSTYSWVPQQSWNRLWTDEALYKKYSITKDEIALIESMIRPMENGDG